MKRLRYVLFVGGYMLAVAVFLVIAREAKVGLVDVLQYLVFLGVGIVGIGRWYGTSIPGQLALAFGLLLMCASVEEHVLYFGASITLALVFGATLGADVKATRGLVEVRPYRPCLSFCSALVSVAVFLRAAPHVGVATPEWVRLLLVTAGILFVFALWSARRPRQNQVFGSEYRRRKPR